jgi:hypothetical protein
MLKDAARRKFDVIMAVSSLLFIGVGAGRAAKISS